MAKNTRSDGITRREFLKGTGAAITGIAVPASQLGAAGSLADAGASVAATAPGPVAISLDVNGIQRTVDDRAASDARRGPARTARS